MARLIAIISLVFFSLVNAQESVVQPLVLVEGADQDQFIAQVQAHTESEIETLLGRAEGVLEKVLKGEPVTPIQFVLHGEEVRMFFRRNYGAHKSIVDQAAKLDAFNVIDIKVCETWMRLQGESLGELYPFIETVPLGPAEERRLVKQGYIYF